MTNLTAHGKAVLPIILLPDATDQESFAAHELRHYLGMMSGCLFEITEYQDQSPALYIGGAALDAGFTTPKQLGREGFTLISGNNSIAILGAERGVIYGAYALLEKLGCRFFTATCEKIPFSENLTLPDFSVCEVPVLEYRAHNYYEFNKYPKFAVKSRLDSVSTVPDRLGGYDSYAWSVHTFEAMVPPTVYGKDHPEYFAMYNNKRHTEGAQQTQLCLTNPEVLEISVESVRRRLHEVPKAKFISISQNDISPGCSCEACRKIDEEEGSPSGTLLRFVNAIAKRLESEFPDVVFDTLAYNYTRPAPKVTIPRQNVCVRLCTIECCFTHSLEECDDSSRMVKKPDGTGSSLLTDLKDWGKITDRIYIWDYTTCFAHYPTPHPNWNVLQKNIRTFVNNGVKGVFEQANGASYGGTDLNELRAYVITRLLWNPDADVSTLITEFTDYYYGAAAPFIRRYIQLLTDKVEQENIHVGFNDNPTHTFLSSDMLDQYDELFDLAEAAVSEDALCLWRIAKARLSIRYIRLKTDAMLRGCINPIELNKFFSDWKAFGLTRIEEWVSPETSLRAFYGGKWRGVEFHRHWLDEGGEQL